jgi:hypothetical protein
VTTYLIDQADSCTKVRATSSYTIPYLKYLLGTKGIGLITASLIFFLTSTLTLVPFLCCPLATYPIAIFAPNVGEGIPEVMTPISCIPAESKILHPSRAGDPMISSPTRRRDGPFAISDKILDRPGNGAEDSDRLSFPASSVVCAQFRRKRTDDPSKTCFDWRD